MKIDPQLLEFAKSMRHTATDAEHLIWQLLRAKRFMSLKFRRQHVIKSYIVDFYCHEIGLVIELDGSQHGTDYFQTEKNYGFMYEIDLYLKWALLHKDLKCKAPLIELNLRRNLGK